MPTSYGCLAVRFIMARIEAELSDATRSFFENNMGVATNSPIRSRISVWILPVVMHVARWILIYRRKDVSSIIYDFLGIDPYT